VSIAHWDEVEKHHRAKGPMDATWSRLGDAAGAKGVGVNRIEIAPGKLSTPPHSHGASEEIYYVLGGSGLAWQDEEVCEVGSGDCIVQVANHFEHTARRPRRTRRAGLRHQASHRDRLAAAVERDPDRLSVGRRARRRP